MAQVQKPRTLRIDQDTWEIAGDLAHQTGKNGVSISELIRNLVHAEAACRRRVIRREGTTLDHVRNGNDR